MTLAHHRETAFRLLAREVLGFWCLAPWQNWQVLPNNAAFDTTVLAPIVCSLYGELTDSLPVPSVAFILDSHKAIYSMALSLRC